MTIWWYDAMHCAKSDTKCYHHWQYIHIAAIIPSYISLCCSVYIIIVTIFYIRHFRKITFGATLPMYISICDAIFHSSHGSDHLHNLITGYLSPGGWCIFLGAMKPFAINGQTAWVLATAVFINYCVRKEHPPQAHYEYFNYFLHIICWSFPFVILIFGFSFNVYGEEDNGPWCGLKKADVHFLMVDMWILMNDFILIVIYSCTGYIIYKKSHINDNEVGINDNQKTKKSLRTLMLFPVIYIVQWSIYLSWKLFLSKTFTETMLTVTITNMGGMFNVIVFYPLLMNPVNKERKEEELRELQTSLANRNTVQSREKKKVLREKIHHLDQFPLVK
eukprot:342149_1